MYRSLGDSLSTRRLSVVAVNAAGDGPATTEVVTVPTAATTTTAPTITVPPTTTMTTSAHTTTSLPANS